jgi:FAD:protein FMN transferase
VSTSTTLHEVAVQSYCENEQAFRFKAMASPCEIRIEGLSVKQAREIADQAIGEVRRIETKYSRYLQTSIVSQINAAAGSEQSIELDDETAQLLNFAASLTRESDGLFDITSGVLRRVWNFREAKLPDPQSLADVLSLVGWQRVEWDGKRIHLPTRGMEIDFGGFGKEYAADRAAAIAQTLGAHNGFVNLGGDLRVMGAKKSGDAWSIGIQHPRKDNDTIASISINQGALATSGDYERFIEIDGKRYCHVLNPRTGMPVAHWQSISVLAPVCTAAGALATIAMLKEEQAAAFLETQGCGYLAINNDGRRFENDASAAISQHEELRPRAR